MFRMAWRVWAGRSPAPTSWRLGPWRSKATWPARMMMVPGLLMATPWENGHLLGSCLVRYRFSMSPSPHPLPGEERGSLSRHHALVAELLDLGLAHPELTQHLIRVLPAVRAGGPHRPRRLRQLDGNADLLDLADLRVLGLHDHLPGPDLRIVEDLFDVVHLPDADVVLDEEVVPLVAGPRPDDRLDLLPRLDFFRVGGADELVGQAAVLDEVGSPDGLAEVLPEPGLGAADREELLVLGLVDRVIGVGAAEEAGATTGGQAVAEEEAEVRRGRKQGERGVEVGHVHVLALPGALAGEERQHDPERAVEARPAVIGDDVQGNGGFAVGLPDQSQNARERQIIDVVGRVVAVGAVLAETGKRAVDDARIELPDRLVIAAEPLHDAGAEAFDNHVCAGGKLLEDRLALGRLEVQRQAPLVPVDV